MKFIICVFLRKIIVLGRFYREKCILDPQNVGELNSRVLIKKMFNWPKKFNKTFLQKNGDLGKFGKHARTHAHDDADLVYPVMTFFGIEFLVSKTYLGGKKNVYAREMFLGYIST